MKYLKKILPATAAVFISSSAANAGTLTFFDDLVNGSEKFSISCTLGCAGWNGSSFVDADANTLLVAKQGSPESEAIQVNSLTGTTAFTTGTKDPSYQGEVVQLTSSAEYLYFKGGTVAGVVYNTGGAGNVFTYAKLGQGKTSGPSLSHVTEFGEVSAVPLPAGVVLLLTGVGGLAVTRRKKVA